MGTVRHADDVRIPARIALGEIAAFFLFLAKRKKRYGFSCRAGQMLPYLWVGFGVMLRYTLAFL